MESAPQTSNILLVLLAVLGSGGVAGIIFSLVTVHIRRKTLLLSVYGAVREMVDTQELREARHYVYEMDRQAFMCTPWQDKKKAEMVMRAFDWLGLVVREGLVPVVLVARFYATPVLKCWYQLSPYIISERIHRDQPGHMWEFEHLAADIIIPGLQKNAGIWKQICDHDRLQQLVDKIPKERQGQLRDIHYQPGDRLWYLFWWKF